MVQKVAVKCEFEARLGHAVTGKLCQPNSKWVPVSNKGRIRQQKERDGLRLSSAVPKIQWDTNPHCPLLLLGYGKPLPFLQKLFQNYFEISLLS